MVTDRRNFLLGTLAGVSAAGLASWGSRALAPKPSEENRPPHRPTVDEVFGKTSFAQQGEDLILLDILNTFQEKNHSYIDIGAFHPILSNNTYLLYQTGARGVLVEPNPALAPALRQLRPRDTVLEAGIGVTDQKEADYFVIKGDGQLNTFSRETAELYVEKYGKGVIERVIKRELLNINDVLAKYLPTGGPMVFSIDVEGLDLEILKTLDFGRFRPLAFCIETSELLTGALETDIIEFMAAKDYYVRGGSFVNSVFIDRRRVAKRRGRHAKPDATLPASASGEAIPAPGDRR